MIPQSPSLFYLFATVAESAPPVIDSSMYETYFYKMLTSLLVLLIASGVILWLFRRFAGNKILQMNAASHIKIIERRAISQKSTIYLVEIAGEKFLIGESSLELRSLQSTNFLQSSSSKDSHEESIDRSGRKE